MGIKVYNQNEEIKNKFYSLIKEKVKNKVNEDSENIAGKISGMFGIGGDIFKTIIGAGLSANNFINGAKGSIGEGMVKFIISFSNCLNKNDTIIINDVVLEVFENEFIQIDHIIISETGVFLIETKNWKGAYQGYNDKWKMKCSTGWTECKSPTSQHNRHMILFKKWLNMNIREFNNFEQFIYPVVIIGASWLKVTNCSIPVVNDGNELLDYIENYNKNIISCALIKQLADKLVNAKPLEVKKEYINKGSVNLIEEGVNKFGEKYVRLKGTIEQANVLVTNYINKGCKVSEIKYDKYDKSIKYFYIL